MTFRVQYLSFGHAVVVAHKAGEECSAQLRRQLNRVSQVVSFSFPELVLSEPKMCQVNVTCNFAKVR